MENYIFKLKLIDWQLTGFIYKIPFPDKNKIIKVLIIVNYSFNEEILNLEDKLKEIDIEKKLEKKNIFKR